MKVFLKLFTIIIFFSISYPLKANYNPIIPLNIYQTWHTKNLPPKMFESVNLIKNLNPRFNHQMFDDNDCREFIKNNFDFSSNEISSIDRSFDVISSCIDMVYNNEDVWSASDCTKKELTDWIETLTSSQFKMIEEFFNTMPKLAHTFKVMNPNTKVESEVTLEGLTSFFG